MVAIFWIGNFPLHFRQTSSSSVSLDPTINFYPMAVHCPRLSVLASRFVSPFRFLVFFLRILVSPIVSLHCLGHSIRYRSSISIAGCLPSEMCVRLLRTFFPYAFAVLGLALLCMKPDKVYYLCRPFSPHLLTFQCTWGAWSLADWMFNHQLCTLCASVYSKLGADARRLGGDIVEILATYIDYDRHWKCKQTYWHF